MAPKSDVLVVGGGTNGLVAAVFLARSGLKVTILERFGVVGGAVRTERPFAKAPQLQTSTGAYLLGVMPPELMKKLGLEVELMRRDPHYFLPTTDSRYLLFGSNPREMEAQFKAFFSAQDWEANQKLQREIGIIREAIAPTWLEAPLSIEATAERYLPAELKQVFVQLCRQPVGQYLERFGFKSDLLKAMYAVTDGFSGVNGDWDTPGTGMNFLVHNMCRLPGSDGTWMIAKGGMGSVSQGLAQLALKAGAHIELNAAVDSILVEKGTSTGVRLKDGREFHAEVVVCNADPFTMRQMVGAHHLPTDYNQRLDGYRRDGSTFKVNLALKGLPKFSCLPEDKGQYGPTIHLLPDESVVLAEMTKAFADVKAGRLPDFPTIEWYFHTPVDPSMKDEHGHHNSALFVQWVPYELAGTTWEAEKEGYVAHLLGICDRFAPGTSELVVDTMPLAPPDIEKHFGIHRGHIHHVDNCFGFNDRLPYETPIAGLYSCSAGTHPAGSVIGAAGHNAAASVLAALGKGPGALA